MKMAVEFLRNYKFKSWQNHSTSGAPVSDADREKTANEIASALASHDKWKSHGHAISRELLWKEIKLRIDEPETVPGLERGLARFWALCNYIFDKSPALKFMVSSKYRYIRQRQIR